MAAEEADSTPTQESFGRQWKILGIVCLALVTAYHYANRVPRLSTQPVLPASNSAGVNWFLIVKFPELPRDEVNGRFAYTRMELWLNTLHKAGFHPVLLSTILERFEKGLPLAPRSVVVVIDPALDHTVKQFLPLLSRYHCPALLLTPENGLDQGDAQYLSWHTIGKIKKTGLFDVGLYRDVPTKFRLIHPRRYRRVDLGFPPEGDGTTINRGNNVRYLNRLRINRYWSQQDLLRRLLAEIPMDRSGYLTVRKIQNRFWGIALDPRRMIHKEREFSMRARPEKRAAVLAWQSTIGLNDMNLRVNVKNLKGELWVFMRTDLQVHGGLRVGFTNEALLIEQTRDSQTYRVAGIPWSTRSQPTFQTTIHLSGRSIAVSVNGTPVLQKELSQAPVSENGMVKLMVCDKARGAARADEVTVFVQPLLTGRPSGDTPAP